MYKGDAKSTELMQKALSWCKKHWVDAKSTEVIQYNITSDFILHFLGLIT